ncbi:homoserine kinase [Kangiella shandongensis]|uniref:homoserine kinase n=1 Tax=Kangiella shandongensis TaxID=2763258 RepID=UPI001CC17756|nr:homoserine kinase [Kangiella shandongensis]
MSIKIFAPASIGNFSVGYDLLGAAIRPIDGSLLGDVVAVKASDNYELITDGRFASQLPGHPDDNIIHHCHELFQQQLSEKAMQTQPVLITLSKNLPVGSGLGSSSSSIVAAFVALNQWYDCPFSEQELLLMMGQMEAQISGSLHYDNIAPCFIGGLQLMTNDNHICQSLPWFNDWYIVIANPGINILTKAARDAIPKAIKLSRATEYAQNLAGFVQALYRQDKSSVAHHLKDVIAEPYRYTLMPNFKQHKAKLLRMGAHAMGISGSGPTIFAVCSNRDIADEVHHYLQKHYNENECAFSYVCKLSGQGAQQLKEESEGVACHS